MLERITKQQQQVVLLYGSTLIGIVLGVLSSIVNTRFIAPSDYGDVRYVQNIISFIASLLLFGYFLSGSRLLAVSNNETHSRRIRGAMVAILCLCGLILVLATFTCYFFHLNRPHLAFLFIVSLPFCCNTLLLNYINTTAQGDNHIGRLAISRCLPAFIYVPAAFLVYKLTGATPVKMILLQNGIPTILLTGIIISTKPSFRNLKPIFTDLNKENKEYGFQLYIGSLAMCASSYLAAIFLGLFNSDNTEVGFYTLALTVTTPLSLLPSIIGTTYFKRFATEDKIPDKVMKFTLIITVLSCICFILLIKPLVLYLYTERYSKVGVYASWLAVGFCVHGIGDMMNRYLGSHGKGKEIRNASLANGFLKIGGFSILVYFFNTTGAIITQVLCSFLYSGMIYYYYQQFVKQAHT